MLPVTVINTLISEYGLLAMFILITLEYACFPISSEFVLPFCGAVASASHKDFLTLLLLSILGGLTGTGICYLAGWFGGGLLLSKITRRFPKSQKGIALARESFKKHGALTVCIGRVIPLIRTYIALVAGAARLDPVSYFCASLLGISIWNTLLIGLGYTLRDNYGKAAKYYEHYKHNLIPIAGIGLLILLFSLIYKKRKKKIIRSTE